jgi:hypothetical protein
VSSELNGKQGSARRTPTGEDRERQLRALKRKLIEAAIAPSSNFSLEDVHKNDLFAVLRRLAGKNSNKPSFDC